GGFRPYTADHLPVIGADPDLPGLWHATGHEGAGIGLSAGTAAVLRDLMLGREPETDAEPFRVDRPAVRPAARPGGGPGCARGSCAPPTTPPGAATSRCASPWTACRSPASRARRSRAC